MPDCPYCSQATNGKHQPHCPCFQMVLMDIGPAGCGPMLPGRVQVLREPLESRVTALEYHVVALERLVDTQRRVCTNLASAVETLSHTIGLAAEGLGERIERLHERMTAMAEAAMAKEDGHE